MESQKYPRTYHFPFSPGTTSDDRIAHDWQGILANELIITEKLDGENTCLKASGVYARSHAAPTRNPWAKNMGIIWSQLKNDLKDLEIFGENLYGVHSIEYQYLEHYFYVFGMRVGDTWLSWEEVEFLAGVAELPLVPVLEKGIYTAESLPTLIETSVQEGSALGGECEGCVVRTAGAFDTEYFSENVLKYVRANHVKTDEHWTKNWKRAKLYFEYAK